MSNKSRSDRWFKFALMLGVPIILVSLFLNRSFPGLKILSLKPSLSGSDKLAKLGGAVTAIAFSPDGQLHCATDNKFVQVWKADIERWRSYTKSPTGMYDNYNFLKFYQQPGDSSGLRLIGGGSSNLNSDMSTPCIVWDGPSRQPLFKVGFSMGGGLDVSSDGTKLATAGLDNVYIFDLTASPKATDTSQTQKSSPSTPQQLPMITKSKSLVDKTSGLIVALAFSPNGKTQAGVGATSLASSANNGYGSGGYSNGGYSSGGYGMGGNSLPILLWDAGTGKLTNQLISPPQVEDKSNPADRYSFGNSNYNDPRGLHSAALAFSPDGHNLIRLTVWGGIERWDLSTNKQVANIPEPRSMSPVFDSFCQALFSPDGSILATCDSKGVALRDPQTLLETRHIEATGPMAFYPDGRMLATGNKKENEVLLWPLD